MAAIPTLVEFAFLDSAERVSKITYRLNDANSLDDADLAGSIVDVYATIDAMATILNLLTWDEILYANLIVTAAVDSTPANVAANNQVVAFTRTRTDSGEKSSLVVPAWDDTVYDQNSANLLSAAYDTVVAGLLQYLADPETGEDMDTVDYSQSRTRKSRNVIND